MKRYRPTVLLMSLALLPTAICAQDDAAMEAFRTAADMVQQGRATEAIPILESVDRSAAPPQVVALLGALYVEAGRSADALGVLAPLADAEDANAVVLYNAGRAAIGVGEPNRGRGYLERSVEQVSSSPASRELGLLYARFGDYLNAYLQLKPWVDMTADDREARVVAALCAVQLGRASEAESLLADLPRTDPQIALLSAKVFILKADPWGALETLEPLVETAPPAMRLDIVRTLAEAYTSVGQASDAVALLIDTVGDNAGVALQLAQAQYQSGDLDGALATLEPFVTQLRSAITGGSIPDGFPPAMVVEYGRLLATAGRHAEALPYLEAATKLDPEGKQSWHQYGQALAAVGRQEEATAALERFQEIVQNEVPASVRDMQLERSLEDPTGGQLRRAMQLMARDEVDEALAITRREAALSPGDIRPYLTEARILLLAERFEEAMAVAETLVASAPESADALYIRGTIHMALESLDLAEADLRSALERSPEHTAALNDLAVLLMERGENGAARELLERALELRPDDALAAENLRQLDQGG